MINPDCYSCKWRGQLSYSSHSKCNHPHVTGKYGLYSLISLIGAHKDIHWNPLNIKVNAHGFKNLWGLHPLDFDPIWIENCDGFEVKDSIPTLKSS